MPAQWIQLVRLEIGYVSDTGDTCTGDKPAEHYGLESIFGVSTLCEWATPQLVEIPDVDDADKWVGLYMQQTINSRLRPGYPRVVIEEYDHLLNLYHAYAKITGAAAGKVHGTRCKIVGREWHNERSYELVQENGEAWPPGTPETNAYFATLTWVCWPKVVPTEPTVISMRATRQAQKIVDDISGLSRSLATSRPPGSPSPKEPHRASPLTPPRPPAQ